MLLHLSRIGLFLFATLLIYSTAVFAQADTTSRAPFVLELPGTTSERYKLPEVRFNSPVTDVPAIKIRVLNPFDGSIDYGKIILTLNGEGINRGCSDSSDSEGKVKLCRSKNTGRIWGYDLKPGKNVLEVTATDRQQKEFYASYVLMLEDKPASDDGQFTPGKTEPPFTGRKFAVIVGVSDYKYSERKLQSLLFADNDARAIANFLQTPQGGKFEPEDVKLLVNENATLSGVRAALTGVAESARPDDLVFIFIAGHGAPDPRASGKKLYFLFHDAKVADMPNTALPMSEFKQYLDTKITAKRVLAMIDTCHSEGVNQRSSELIMERGLVEEGDENNLSNFQLKQLFKQTGRAILTSSGVNETSREGVKWDNHGVFTWALLEGLKGAADTDNDTLITAGEIFQYTRDSVREATDSKQNPIALPGSAMNLMLASYTRKDGSASSAQVDDSISQRSITSLDFQKQRRAVRRKAPPASKNAKRRKSIAAVSNPKRKYKPVKSAVKLLPKSKVIRNEELGVTFWRLRPRIADEEDDAPTFKVPVGKGRYENWTAARVPSTTTFKEGDRVRFTIESPRTGYMYIINREVRKDETTVNPKIIFPTTQTRAGNNRVTAGSLIDIPASNDRITSLRIESDEKEYAGEELLVLILPDKLENFEIGKEALSIPPKRVEELVAKYGTFIEVFDAEDGDGVAYTAAEAEAATNSRSLVQDDPFPQTLYRVKIKKTDPMLIVFRMQAGP